MANQFTRYTGESKRTTSQAVDYEPPRHPCLAIVRNHLDSTFMGGLEVQLLDKTGAGNPPNDPGSFFKCKYLSPFYGVTPLSGTQPNPGDEHTQKSYGMWFVPPDIGSLVLVIFAEGGEAFWIGCVPERDTNFMVPSGDAATSFTTEEDGVKRPVAEINKKILKSTDAAAVSNATKIPKPVNTPIDDVIFRQGLAADETRGLTTSSARRETPSSVFGISTPGPYDRRPDAPKVQYSGNTEVYHNRLGGSSIVMDDGDPTLLRKSPAATGVSEYADTKRGDTDGDVTIPHNEMLRLKTRTGHQIVMHNAEDLIYIINSQGTSWIEITANGKIDIYSKDSVSVHSETDLNFKADRDINIEAGRDVNLKANNNIAAESVNDFQLIVGKDNKITTEGLLDVNTKGNNNFTSREGNTEIKTKGDHIESTGGKIKMNGPQATEAAKAQPLTTWGLPRVLETIMRRVPQAEPWTHHENLAPLNFTPEETDVKKSAESGQGITGLPPISGEQTETQDTFRRGT